MSRRLLIACLIACAFSDVAAEPIDVGTRRELFVDEFLAECLEGVRLALHHPVPREVAVVHDTDWEGNTCGYHTVFQDGELYTMDGPKEMVLADQLTADGRSDARLTTPGRVAWGEAMLLLNVATSAAGSVRCELQSADGVPVPGFTMKECDTLFGDGVEQVVSWGGGRSELEPLAGKPIRLRLELKDADIYAIRFGQPEVEANGPR